MNTPIYLPMTVAANVAAVSMSVAANVAAFELTPAAAISVSILPDYEGATEITPSGATQTLLTADRVLRQNIVINPIPSNYGLIGWDGAVLTVS